MDGPDEGLTGKYQGGWLVQTLNGTYELKSLPPEGDTVFRFYLKSNEAA
jgi:hypothetical protein